MKLFSELSFVFVCIAVRDRVHDFPSSLDISEPSMAADKLIFLVVKRLG